MLIETQTGSEAYVSLGQAIMKTGHQVTSRGKQATEIEACITVIRDATQAVPLGTTRRVNRRIGAAEYCQLLGGISFLEQLDAASAGRFSQFASNGRLQGAYGPRIVSQLPQVAKILEDDPGSRQAVLVIGRGTVRDQADGQLDVPCTTTVQYLIRGGKLDAIVTMRSSDWFLGIPYDWWMQSRLQMSLAAVLGLQAGQLIWIAGSQHVYKTDSDQALNIALADTGIPQPPAIEFSLKEFGRFYPFAYARMVRAQDRAKLLCLYPEDHAGTQAADYYREVLPVVEGRWGTCEYCRYVMRHDDLGENYCIGCAGEQRWKHG